MSRRIFISCMLLIFSTAISSPVPGGWHKHEHHIIHVPYHVHHLHHYHKYPVYIKSKPIVIKEHHYVHHDVHHDEHSSFSDPWESD